VCGSGCSAEDLLARPSIWLLGRGSVCSGRQIGCVGRKSVAPAGGCLLAARDRSPRPASGSPSAARPAARVGSRLLGGPSARSGHGPAPSPLESFAPRVVRQIRQPARLLGRPAALVGVEDACGGIRPPASGTGMSAPALDVSARRSIRWLRSPIRRLGSRSVVSRIRSVVSGVGFVGFSARCVASLRPNDLQPPHIGLLAGIGPTIGPPPSLGCDIGP
jgi:hypothetical protein